ncbi:nitroreductase family protein [Streptomyces sp. NPDC048290]|uniref:nitroreductase family protein n=1 Tax=Streptomyces sp. NPDC048290 TaxID=3155811 RepID=UPI0034180E73
MGHAHDYATAILHRGRIPMEPADFVPDWADRPRKAKYYPGSASFPLPEAPDSPGATVTAGLLGGADGDGPFSLPLLSGMLLDSYGLTGRRLGVQANTDLAALPHYPQANWSRGTASGGGLYPVSVYWVSGSSGPLTPGVHHYSPPRHAFQRLLTGDVSGEVAAALGAGPQGTDQYLVLGVKYWQNAFKYNSFSFHAVSMDVGALLQTWRVWGRSRGLRPTPALWFDEDRLAALLGLDGDEEGLFAVVPLRWEPTGDPVPVVPSDGGLPTPALHAAVRRRDQERSRTVLEFETLRRIHRATVGHATDRPAPGALAPTAPAPPGARDSAPPGARDSAAPGALAPTAPAPPGVLASAPPGVLAPTAPAPPGARASTAPAPPETLAATTSTPPGTLAATAPPGAPDPTTSTAPTTGEAPPLALPPAAFPDVTVETALRARRSSFGRFDASVPVTAAELAATLAACAATRLDSDAETPDSPARSRLYVFVNHVEGVEPGAYAYDPGGHTLRPVVAGAPGAFLQRNYFLSNYNLEQTGAVIVPTVRTAAVLDAVGDRGYRLVNAVVGAVAQSFYTAAAALGLGAGVALGFDSIAYIEELGLADSGEAPLLIMLLGRERPGPADFRSELV